MSGQMLVSDYNLVTSAFSLENGRSSSGPGTRLNTFLGTVTRVQLTPDNSNPRWFPSYSYCNFSLGNANPRWLEPPANSKLFLSSAVLINHALLVTFSVFKISTYLLMLLKWSCMILVLLPYPDPISFLSSCYLLRNSNCFLFPLKVWSSYRESIVLILPSQARIIGQRGSLQSVG